MANQDHSVAMKSAEASVRMEGHGSAASLGQRNALLEQLGHLAF